MSLRNDIELLPSPSDGITAVRYSDVSRLLVSSWDATLRLYDTKGRGSSSINTSDHLVTSFKHLGAVLDACFVDRFHVCSGSLDKTIRQFELSSSSETKIGEHEQAVRCVEYSDSINALISGSWDSTVKVWDLRASSCTSTLAIENKCFTMSLVNNRLVVGTAGRRVLVYDLRNMSEPEQNRESPLKHQTRCVRIFPDATGFALSSIEGRVAIEYFDPAPEVQAKKYAFRCHRATQNGTDLVYPVNAIAYHPRYGTFATGGCDGVVNMWDGLNKKRICQLRKFDTSISSLAFNSDGSELAIAVSYTFEEGEKDHPSDAVHIATVVDEEVAPRQRK